MSEIDEIVTVDAFQESRVNWKGFAIKGQQYQFVHADSITDITTSNFAPAACDIERQRHMRIQNFSEDCTYPFGEGAVVYLYYLVNFSEKAERK